jgi:low temperature requirement protein LtrA
MALHLRMGSRDPSESHRTSTPLELLFDLTFVVAIAEAGSSLQRGLVGGHAAHALLGYSLVFFAIWWAWMNFTWFASAYDTDDVAYRLAVFVQMTGVLILAVGVPRAIEAREFAVITVGYVVMRLALVAQWLRAAASHPEGRRCARRYAAGIALVQVAWVIRLVLPADVGMVVFVVLAAAELAVPIWAEAAGRTAWHPGHIAERYGLFTIIVLGEAVSAATFAMQGAADAHTGFGRLLAIAAGGLLTVFSMWWLYFDLSTDRIVEQVRRAFVSRPGGAFGWGYGHYLVFMSAAAVGAGLTVAVDHATHNSTLTRLQTAFAFTVPTAAYLAAVWAIHFRYKRPSLLRTFAVPVTTILILASSITPEPVLATGALLATLVAVTIARPPVITSGVPR